MATNRPKGPPPPVRVPLVPEPENRLEDTRQDAKLVNGFIEQAEDKKIFVHKRPGLALLMQTGGTVQPGSTVVDGSVVGGGIGAGQGGTPLPGLPPGTGTGGGIPVTGTDSGGVQGGGTGAAGGTGGATGGSSTGTPINPTGPAPAGPNAGTVVFLVAANAAATSDAQFATYPISQPYTSGTAIAFFQYSGFQLSIDGYWEHEEVYAFQESDIMALVTATGAAQLPAWITAIQNATCATRGGATVSALGITVAQAGEWAFTCNDGVVRITPAIKLSAAFQILPGLPLDVNGVWAGFGRPTWFQLKGG